MEDYTFFYKVDGPNGYCSNWWMCNFTDGENTYCSTEQYMMFHKACMFGDYDIAFNIMNTKSQFDIRALGRRVRNYKDSIWLPRRYDIVLEANRLKFTQNKDLAEKLKATKGIIVECAPNDLSWGIGISLNDENRFDQTKWRGQNLLGKVLMQVRDEL